MAFPFSISWTLLPAEETRFPMPAQVLIVAPKRIFHNAVDRNRAKRLMRECYRLIKPELYTFLEERQLKVAISLRYTHNEILSFAVMQRKYAKAMAVLMKDIDAHRP